jgi:hypothetical protein
VGNILAFYWFILYYIIHQLFLATDIPPSPSCYSDVNAFVYFVVVYYISNFSLQISLLNLHTPMLDQPGVQLKGAYLIRPAHTCHRYY